jgi:hypothetical protein
VLDRKLVPLYDLMDLNFAPEILCSERLVEALEDLGVTGWSAVLVPHATPNQVAGHRAYRLTCEGFTGPIIDTEIAWKAGAGPQVPRGREDVILGHPIPPVSFDATEWTGHDLCWSPWLGMTRLIWRALIARGSVVRALLERIPDLTFGTERVQMVGLGPRPALPPGRHTGANEPPPPPPPPLADILDRIQREAQSRQHTLPPGATTEDIRASFAALGGPVPKELEEILGWSNGAVLFGGARSFYTVREGMIAFAEMREGAVVWAFDREGRVHGLGREGIPYGPGAPFLTWFEDQVADLAYAWDNVGVIPWAGRMLE